MNKLLTACLLLISLIYLPNASLYAAPGDLDRSFGTEGIANNSFPNIFDLHGTFLPDGKYVVLGSLLGGGPSGQDFFIARFNADGSPDTSFDGDGQVTVAVSPQEDVATGAAVQSDGKLVIAGYTRNASANYDFAVVRLNDNGSQDTGFDGDGIKITVMPGSEDRADGVVIQSDGKIVLGGNSFASGTQNMMLARYNADGSPDTSFDGDGVSVATFSAGPTTGNGLTIQSDGKLILVGALGTAGGFQNSVFGIARFNTNGSPDTSFGGTGLVPMDVRTGVPQQNGAEVVLVQPDGKIVAAGATNNGPTNTDFAITRVNADGSPDNDFGTGGKVVNSSAGARDDLAHAIAIQPDGKLLVAGASPRTDTAFMILRFNTNGTLDPTFGNNGTSMVPISEGSRIIRSFRILPGGKFIAGSPMASRVSFARFQGNGVREADFDGDKRSDISLYRPSEGNWYLLQSQAGFLGFHFGIPTDKIAPADYDGDGKTDFGVYRDGTWYLQNSTTGFTAANFGIAEDIPQPADFDGDGKAEIAVFRPSEGNWYTLNLVSGQFTGLHFGLTGDRPVAADYDGDGKTDYAVYRPSEGNWYILASTDGFIGTHFGISTDVPVPADYDGDGKTDRAVYRDGTWFLDRSFKGFAATSFGITTDAVAPADYDGDGRADTAVFRPSEGTWYLLNSMTGFQAFQFGLSGDNPVPASIFR